MEKQSITHAREVPNNRDRLYYLEQYTAGEAQQLVKSYITMDEAVGYKEAKKALAKKYGDPFKLAEAYMERVLQFPDIKSEDKDALSNFSLLLLECKNVMSNLKHLEELNHTRSIQQLMRKLPFELRDRWRTKTDFIQEDRQIEYKDFVKFVENQAKLLKNPTYGDIKDHHQPKPANKPRPRNNYRSFAVLEEAKSCLHCKGVHDILDCTKFNDISKDEKVKFIKENKLCFGCLGAGHMSKSCENRQKMQEVQQESPNISTLGQTNGGRSK
ncbi:uncharacterized protein [Antedon mediterranea]|uniref:uncharacterized protein n=1 Tax=Antedon mediterranea TaxID=105859 RepID=UPI003AF4E959